MTSRCVYKLPSLFVVLAMVVFLSLPVFGESLGESAAQALFQTNQVKTRAAATSHSSNASNSSNASRHAAASHKRAAGPSKNAALHTEKHMQLKRRAAAKTLPTQGSENRKSDWHAEGATNLDAIKDMGPMAGLLIMGPTFDMGGAGALATGASQAGLTSALIWGVCGAIGGGVLGMLSAALQPKHAGARPVTSTGSSGAPVIAGIAMFIGVFCIKLFVFPDHPVDLNSASRLVFEPTYSNEFGIHCVLPKDPLKGKFIEKANNLEIAVNVAGYRNGKNEMMIGYAHLPSVDEMVKARQAPTIGQIPQLAQLGTLQPANVRYYFDVGKALDAAVDGAAKRANFKVSYRCEIKVDGNLPGREYEGSADRGRLVRGRVFIGYNNYYHAVVAGDPSFVNSNDAYKFLDSIKVQ